MHTKFQAHAIACGLDMAGRRAVPVAESLGRIVAIEPLHPETLNSLIPEGFRICAKGVQVMQEMGLDYVVCEDY